VQLRGASMQTESERESDLVQPEDAKRKVDWGPCWRMGREERIMEDDDLEFGRMNRRGV